jgi:hypothetical protein
VSDNCQKKFDAKRDLLSKTTSGLDISTLSGLKLKSAMADL